MAEVSQRAAEETGVASMLSFRLFAEGDTLGALNLYSQQHGAFDDEAVAVGSVFATHAAVALAGAQHDEQMQKALQTRNVIGQAKGILMAHQHVTADEAFDILRRASQRTNITPRELAERVGIAHAARREQGAAWQVRTVRSGPAPLSAAALRAARSGPRPGPPPAVSLPPPSERGGGERRASVGRA